MLQIVSIQILDFGLGNFTNLSFGHLADLFLIGNAAALGDSGFYL